MWVNVKKTNIWSLCTTTQKPEVDLLWAWCHWQSLCCPPLSSSTRRWSLSWRQRRGAWPSSFPTSRLLSLSYQLSSDVFSQRWTAAPRPWKWKKDAAFTNQVCNLKINCSERSCWQTWWQFSVALVQSRGLWLRSVSPGTLTPTLASCQPIGRIAVNIF